jgi:hypothetical protein
MSVTNLTSELEAINVLLSVADEAPVQSLTVTGLLPLTNARAALDEVSRLVQSGGWKFNTEYDYPLTRETDNTIKVPGNAVKVDVNDEYLGSCDPVQRGLKLYDAKNHSYTYTTDLKATVVFLLPWDELPQPARHYIMVKAARTFQAREMGSESIDRFTDADEQAALLAFSSHENDVGDHNVLNGNWSCASVVYGREPYVVG